MAELEQNAPPTASSPEPAAAAPEEPPKQSETTEAPAPAAEGAPKEPEKKPWFLDRIDKLTYERNQRDLEIDNLKRQLAAKAQAEQQRQQAPALTEADVQARAAAMAQQMAVQKAFDDRCNDAYAKGKESYGMDFDAAFHVLSSVGGNLITPQFLDAAIETGKGHDILYALGKDPEKAMELLSMPPGRQAVRLAQMAAGVESKPRASKAPDPITPQVGTRRGGGPDLYDPNLSVDEFMALRTKQLKERRTH